MYVGEKKKQYTNDSRNNTEMNGGTNFVLEQLDDDVPKLQTDESAQKVLTNKGNKLTITF